MGNKKTRASFQDPKLSLKRMRPVLYFSFVLQDTIVAIGRASDLNVHVATLAPGLTEEEFTIDAEVLHFFQIVKDRVIVVMPGVIFPELAGGEGGESAVLCAAHWGCSPHMGRLREGRVHWRLQASAEEFKHGPQSPD